MKQIILIFFCLLISLAVNAQGQSGTVKVKKSSCCNALDVGLTSDYFNDTISYNALIQENFIHIYSTYCKRHGSFPVISFELSINNKKRINIEGNKFNFSSLGSLREGGKITITNCMVNCKMRDTIPQIVIIKPKDIYITASE